MLSSKRAKASLAVSTLCVALIALTGCTNASETAGAPSVGASAPVPTVVVDAAARALLPAAIRDKGTLVIASDPSYAPFESLAADNKTMVGFDVQLTDLLAESLGLKTDHEAATFDAILPGLTSGRYDVGMSAFSITAVRKQKVDFVPYMQGGTALGVLTGNPMKLHLEDGSLCGHSVAVQNGSVQAQVQAPAFSKQCTDAGKKPIDIKSFPTQSDANLALTSGRVDALVSTGTTLGYQGKQAGDKFEVVPGAPYQPTGVGMAVNKGNSLTKALEAAMTSLMASPAYAETFKAWNIPSDNMLSTADFKKYSE